MSKNPQLAFKMVSGTTASTILAARLVLQSAYFQVTPMPGDEFEFAVKIEQESLLADQAHTNLRTYEVADFSTMDMPGMVAWYVRNVGYDPVAAQPGTELEELRALCTEMLQIDLESGSDWFVLPETAEMSRQQSNTLEAPITLADGASMVAPLDSGICDIKPLNDALESLGRLANDIGMLASGDWVPDDDTCEASLDNVECARSFVTGVLEILMAAKRIALDVEKGACPNDAAKQLKEMMVRLGLWDGHAKDLDDE